jgi:hypothetical protein
MHRKRLVATVAAAPLLLLAHGAWAETTITTAVTEPVATSTTNDDVRVTSTGSIKPTVEGPALLMDTNDNITNEGAISTTGVNGSIGMQAGGDLTGNVTNKGAISIIEDYTPTDTDPDGTGPQTGDGDLDGPFALGEGRYGIRVTGGAGPLTGSVLNDTGASIIVEGNESAGISIESGLTGSLTNNGSISVLGGDLDPEEDNLDEEGSYGIRTTGDIGGSVILNGAIGAQGEGSIGVAIDSNVGGGVRIQGGITSRGFRYTTRSTEAADRALLDADDLLVGGPAVRIGGNVANGIFLDARPADLDDEEDDEDDDGIADANEGTGAITAYGSAPALLIGSTTDAITIGVVGTGDDAYGLVSKGGISADGVFDGFAATALQIGAATDVATTIAGGIRNDTSITVRSFQANSTGVVLKDETTLSGTGLIWNKGQITAQTIVNSAPLVLEGAFTATAVLLEAGSTATTLRNAGVIGAQAVGERSNAVAVRDLGGTLDTIENTGRIQAIITPTDDASDSDDTDIDPSNETIVGKDIAIDVAASTTGVTITQTGIDDGDDDDDEDTVDPDADEDGVDDADEPLIFGDVMLGSGADTITLNNGALIGDTYFGDGADTLNINGGTLVSGAIDDTDGLLTINLNDGRLAVANTETINATALNVGAEGILLVTIDPEDDTATRFVVDTADFATDSQIGVQVTGLLTFENLNDTKDYVIVDAGVLTAGTIDNTLLSNSPYIYNVGITADEDTDQISLSVRRRTAAEAGLNASQTAAFDAFYLAIAEDEDVRDEFLERFTRQDFLTIYNQMLPDQGEGLFSALDYASLSIARAAATRPDLRQRYGPDSFWLQEINVQVKRDGGETLGSESKGFGFVGGYESMDDKGGALGATLAYLNAEENDDAAQVGEQTTVSLFEAGAYWRRASGAWLFSVRGGAGYAFFDGTRRFVAPITSATDLAVIRQANAEWNGFTASGNASVAYEHRFGRYYARPTLAVDYFYLSEGERVESGGGDAFDQSVEERTSSRLSGTAEVAFGAEFGRDFWWRPEVKLGFRQVLAGEVGDTVARFGTGNPFTLSAMEPGEGAAIIGFGIKAGTPMSYLALEAEMERVKSEQRYNAKLSGRVMF